MMRFSLFVLLTVCLIAPSYLAQPTVERGKIYRCEDPAYAIWIPRGLTRQKEPRSKHLEVEFLGRTRGAYQIGLGPGPGDTLAGYVEVVKNSNDQQFSGCSMEVLEGEKAGRYEAVIIVTRKLDGTEKYKDYEAMNAGIQFGDEVVNIIVMQRKGQTERALEQLRWMLGTFRPDGAAGLSTYLHERRTDKQSGLSFRPPRGFRPVALEDGDSRIFAGENKKRGMTLALLAAGGKPTDKALKDCGKDLMRKGRPWTSPHEGDCRPLAAFYVSEDGSRGRAAVAIQFEGTQAFAVQVDGSCERCEALMRTAELVAQTMTFVDIEAARAEVAAALVAFEAARKKRRSGEIKTQAMILARYPIVDDAARTLAKTLTRLDDPQTQLAVARALANADQPELVADLIRAARYFKSRKQNDVLAALMTALGSVRGPKAVPLLLSLARRGAAEVSAAAVRSLGRYTVSRDKIVKDLIRTFDKAEAAARKTDLKARERWLVMKPAFHEALDALTGQTFKNAAAAKAWLRAR